MKRFTVIIPARNELAQIGDTLEAVLAAVSHFERQAQRRLDRQHRSCEVLVVDNASEDGTGARATEIGQRHEEVRVLHCASPGAPRARNHGAAHARGEVLVFVDADTRIPPRSLARIDRFVANERREAGIFRLASKEPGLRARCWWSLWNYVRLLPLARAKALPAFMFCTRSAFHRFGPFDERILIGEEWPILAGLYRAAPQRLVYDWTTVAHSSSRRMELRRFGYTRLLARYCWAVAHHRGRLHHPDTIRQQAGGAG